MKTESDDADEARKDPPHRLQREKSPYKHFDFWPPKP